MFCQQKLYDIIRQTTTLLSIPTTSAAKAANNIYRVFFTLTQLVYIAIVYKVVSVEPIIVDAIIPIILSTPQFFIISVATAIELLPDIGLNKAKALAHSENLQYSKLD